MYRPHWAFEVPARPAVPADNGGWAKNAIDAFILARLKKEGLKPSPEADKQTLIRRVTLDLTGLLPTPAEVRAFVNDTSPQAYEQLVDGLLARPTFGEQRARYWLDYARYADTYGLHYDNSKDIWPYRDYVIRSFNDNKPFDQFAMEQIAGDLMPAKNLDPLIGSGYVRLGLSTNEGGTITEELRVNIARERTEAFGATFMGLTVGCAVCHDHKFDPTTQKDFYSLSAFFNNIDEKPFNDDRPVWAPAVRIPKSQNENAYNRILAERSQLAAVRLRCACTSGNSRETGSHPGRIHPGRGCRQTDLRLRLDEGTGDVLKNSAPNANPASFRATVLKPEWGETTWLWPDFRMQSSTRVLLDQTGDYDGGQAFSSGGWFMLRSAPYFAVGDTAETLISKMDASQHFRGWDLSIRKGIVSVELVNQAPKEDPKQKDTKAKEAKESFRYPTPQDLTKKDLSANKPPEQKKEEEKSEKKKPEKKKDEGKKPEPKDTTPEVAIKVSATDALPVDGRWKHIFFTYDGSGRAAGIKIYINGRPAATRVVADSLSGASIRTKAPNATRMALSRCESGQANPLSGHSPLFARAEP